LRGDISPFKVFYIFPETRSRVERIKKLLYSDGRNCPETFVLLSLFFC
jgi:hypothetical protein